MRELSAYELDREANIRRNNAYLASLGLGGSTCSTTPRWSSAPETIESASVEEEARTQIRTKRAEMRSPEGLDAACAQLFAAFPGREREIDALLSLCAGHEHVAVLGPSASGKTAVCRAVLEAVGEPFAWISCAALSAATASSAAATLFERAARALSVLEKTPKLPTKFDAPGFARWLEAFERATIVLDDAHVLFSSLDGFRARDSEAAAGVALVSWVARLASTRLRVIVVGCDRAFAGPTTFGLPLIRVVFSAYAPRELGTVLETIARRRRIPGARDAGTYRRFVDQVVGVARRHTSDARELMKLCASRPLFDLYDKADGPAAAFSAVKHHLKLALDNIHDPHLDVDRLVLGGAEEEKTCGVPTTRLLSELSPRAILALLAAFVASYSSKDADKLLFTTSTSKRRRKTAASPEDVKTDAGPQAVPLDRLLSVHAYFVAAHAGGDPLPIRDPALLQQLASLTALRLLDRATPLDDLNHLKYSAALVSDGAHSFSDLLTDGVALLTYRASRKPPDDDHPFGHGKIEAAGTFGVGGALLLAAGGAATHATHAATSLVAEPSWIAICACVASVAAKEYVYRITKRVGEEERSTVIVANAEHHRSDALSSVASLCGIAAANLVHPACDPLAGVCVAIMVGRTGLVLSKGALDELLDASVHPSVVDRMRRTVATRVPGATPGDLRARKTGPGLHVTATLKVRAHLTASAAHQMGEHARKAIVDAAKADNFDVLDVSLHFDPDDRQELDDMHVLLPTPDKVERLIRDHCKHHIAPQISVRYTTDNRVAATLDLCLRPDLRLRDAARIATKLRRGLLKKIPLLVDLQGKKKKKKIKIIMALRGKAIAIFCDFQFEDMEVMYPKLRLEEEGAKVLIVGAHPAGIKYTGKYGYPIKSDVQIDAMGDVDAIVVPGGFAPDYMRRNQAMLKAISTYLAAGKPVAAICHGPWMFCSARNGDGNPVVIGRKCTSFHAIKDDVINAGGLWVDESVVADGNIITSRTPQDLTPFCQAIIAALK
ncbi:hypothetical protein CTAYLR_009460 [Chrysophaeum taylorii]|uniref:DJ-1/PfpI domain-containing protein n=1 Tax=Chrysophaeum taylorii TaxID=2483200 RepID=A0AAD7U658_9STRA|nr:hypothetical protein CTAYLR_009460 [Chrysophaeum taylorii]